MYGSCAFVLIAVDVMYVCVEVYVYLCLCRRMGECMCIIKVLVAKVKALGGVVE